MDFRPLIESAKQLGLEGDELREYVEREKRLITEQEEKVREREERARERESKKHELEMQVKAEENRVRMMEIEMERERLKSAETLSMSGSGDKLPAKMPKLPNFDEGKDDIDSYLQRFERFAIAAKWDKNTWATTLSAYLRGTALSVFSRLTAAESLDYDKVKVALLKRFQMTEEGFRTKYRTSQVQYGELTSQYATRLDSYLDRWVELAKVPKTYDGLKDLMLREQLLQMVSKPLALYLRERNPKSVQEMGELADLYNEAHADHLQSQVSQTGAKLCYICGGKHLARDCPAKRERAGAMFSPSVNTRGRASNHGGGYENGREGGRSFGSHGRNYKPSGAGKGERSDHIAGLCKLGEGCSENDQVKLQCGCELPIMSAVFCRNLKFGKPENMPVGHGLVGQRTVAVLRDTGCSGVVVKAAYVRDEEYTGEVKRCVLIDGTLRRYPVANILIKTSYYTGQVDALVMENPVYDLIVGNIGGLKNSEDLRASGDCSRGEVKSQSLIEKVEDEAAVAEKETQIEAGESKGHRYVVETEDSIEVNAVQKIAQKKAEKRKTIPLKRPIGLLEQDKHLIAERQQSCESLANIRQKVEADEHKVDANGSEVWFEMEEKLIYRKYKRADGSGLTKQLVVPKSYRDHVLKMGHDHLMSGHLGIKKTTDRILTEFYWPGIWSDTRRYCRSCRFCQRTFPKGKVSQLSISDMPLIDAPFKRTCQRIQRVGYRFAKKD